MTKTAVAEKPETKQELVSAGIEHIPDFLVEDVDTFAGAGVSTDQADFLIPFLGIAQSNSPQLKKQQEDKYIRGLEAGDIFNTATGQYWPGKEGVRLVVAFFKKAEVEWIQRSKGGGYVATHEPNSKITKTVRVDPADPRLRIVNGDHQLVETAYWFVTEVETATMAVVSMTSTALGTSRQWQTIMGNVRIPSKDGATRLVAPCFSRVYRLKTVYRKNDQGDWFQPVIVDEGWVGPSERDAYLVARDFFKNAEESGVQLGRPPVSEESGETVEHEDDSTDGDEPPI